MAGHQGQWPMPEHGKDRAIPGTDLWLYSCHDMGVPVASAETPGSRGCQASSCQPRFTLEPSRLPVPGSDTASVLQAIKEGEIFGLALVDIHMPAHLRDKFRDLPPIFKTCEVSRDDVGEKMRAFCERTGSLARPRRMLNGGYFAVKSLIPTPLLRWYLQQGLEVTRLYLLRQYQPQQCFQEVTEDAANKRRQAQLDPSQELAGESSKLLINSVYGKTCENKLRFREYRFINRPAVRKALRSHRFRSLETLKTGHKSKKALLMKGGFAGALAGVLAPTAH